MSEQKTEQKTLRDEFAMAAMREILAHSETRHISEFGTGAFEDVAVGSYQMADAMLAARPLPTPPKEQA